MPRLESGFQPKIIEEIQERWPGAYVLKNDPTYIWSFPDLTCLLPNGKWVVLESKRSTNASKQAQQEWYVNDLNRMSYSSFVHPRNLEEVLDGIQHTLFE